LFCNLIFFRFASTHQAAINASATMDTSSQTNHRPFATI